MKILAVGDLHGRYTLVDRAERKFIRGKYDRLLFLGDYADSESHSFGEQIRCIDKINRLMDAYPEEVIALTGNHDHMAYVYGYNHHTGFQSGAAANFRMAFEDGYYRVAWQYDNWLFTHAGVTTGWFEANLNNISKMVKLLDDGKTKATLADALNALMETKERACLSECSRERGGHYMHGSPLWAGKAELIQNPIMGYNQVVGHTRVPCIQKYNYKGFSLNFTDCLDEMRSDDGNFLTLELE